MKARVKWSENASFVAESGSGHALVVDGPPEIGGRNLGPRPMELLLMGVGACSSVDVTLILKKSRQQVVDCWVELEADRAETEPKVFTEIRMHFVVIGRDLAENHVRRAVELSAEKYCSASIMLGRGGVNIRHSYEIRAAA
ncbi:OsmC family protein [Sinimarinibacterium sp. CAU 1509]|uniref:OsmC family protein n=1 Tax=Sinimarinibacterium sp. CAU 1509 TaxID=2562283 RepID=UPI0010AC5606|nr:OsmC family protein [Sinimarinibacterium sp. CAU 1509]TJY65093.1 OsmC family protein [Sinimarinibacterium sp. CAU 1509]